MTFPRVDTPIWVPTLTIVCAFSAWYGSSPLTPGVAGAAGAVVAAGAGAAGADVAGAGVAEDAVDGAVDGAARCSSRDTREPRSRVAASAVVEVDGACLCPWEGRNPVAARVPQQKIA